MKTKNKKTNIIHARTCVYNVIYHIVWSTKYRREVLKGEIEETFKNIAHEIVIDKDFIIHTMEVMPDHVHVFVSSHPKIAPSYIVKMLKGITARRLFLLHSEIKKQLWDGHLWNSSFYIETIGDVSRETIEKYIENQKRKR